MRLLCWLGFHSWTYHYQKREFPWRACPHCQTKQVASGRFWSMGL